MKFRNSLFVRNIPIIMQQQTRMRKLVQVRAWIHTQNDMSYFNQCLRGVFRPRSTFESVPWRDYGFPKPPPPPKKKKTKNLKPESLNPRSSKPEAAEVLGKRGFHLGRAVHPRQQHLLCITFRGQLAKRHPHDALIIILVVKMITRMIVIVAVILTKSISIMMRTRRIIRTAIRTTTMIMAIRTVHMNSHDVCETGSKDAAFEDPSSEVFSKTRAGR